jgi:hypothetical protein
VFNSSVNFPHLVDYQRKKYETSKNAAAYSTLNENKLISHIFWHILEDDKNCRRECIVPVS